MIKFDFTSHFIIVLCLMVILVSTLIIINYSVNSKWDMGAFYVMSKGLQSICYATAFWDTLVADEVNKNVSNKFVVTRRQLSTVLLLYASL